MRNQLFLGLFLVGLPPHVASATPAVAVSSDSEPREKRVELDVGMLIGGSDVGDATGAGTGVVLGAGLRLDNISLLGELNYIAVGDERSRAGARRGRMSRIGLLARYSILSTGDDRSLARNDFWVEGGLGRHQVAWNGGGTLTRNDAVLGFGYQLNGRIGRRDPNPRYLGPYFALRAHLARAPEDLSTEPTCGGPCDEMTRASRNDVSLFFHFGLNFGR